MQQSSARAVTSMVGVALFALVVGFGLGRGWGPGDVTSARQGQATPAAECLPSHGGTPQALATPAATGLPLTYADGWTVTVTGATKLESVRDYVPEGIFVAVSLTITNDTATERFFPFEELRLLDDEGRPFLVGGFITNQYANSKGIHHTFSPSLPTDTAVVFDVREDAGDSFILQSTADPSFRVSIDLALRGSAEEQSAT